MQNIQNTEIQQRVINLVELYRTKVGKESQIALDAKADYEYWLKQSIDMMVEGALPVFGMSGEGPHTEVWIRHLMVNEQLLGYFYSVVAGEKADKDVLDQLLPDVYDKTIFTEEEESFLKDHFREMVNYIILTPCDDSLEWVHRLDGKDAFTIPNEVLELIKSRVEIAAGSRVFYPNTAFAQLANLFEGCSFYCDTMFYAWTKVAIFANMIATDSFNVEGIPSSLDAIVSYLQKVSEDSTAIMRICQAYNSLPSGGKLVLLCPSGLLADGECSTFRRMLVEDNAIKEIIQLPKVMSSNASSDNYCLLIAIKGNKGCGAKLADARDASMVSDKKNFEQSFDNAKLDAIMQNGGYDPSSGLRKVVTIPSDKLSEHLLVPQVYTVERPLEDEQPVPLSSICQLVKKRIRDVGLDLPLDTPYIFLKDLAPTFKGALDISKLDKIGFPNKPSNMKVHDITDEELIPYVIDQEVSYEEQKIAFYRSALYLDGNKDAVLWFNDEDSVKSALYQSTGKDAAVSFKMFGMDLIYAFNPNPGIDALSLLAILNMPIVYRQMIAYSEFGLNQHLDDILVPTNKRIIGDEVKRMLKEQESYKKQEELLAAKKTEYINEVRMRKHDMGQYIFELGNIEDLIRYYIENRDTEKNYCKQIEDLLDNFRSSLDELSTLLDNLSKEEHFGEPELFNLDVFLSQLANRHKADGYSINYELDKQSFKKFSLKIASGYDILEDIRANIDDTIILKDENTNVSILEVTKIPHKAVPTLHIAPNDIYRAINNIIDNARRHGFTDPNRKDYEIKVSLSIDVEREMYQIDFRNNGNPLPEGMNKMRYGIKGEKAGKTSGTGLGGNYVKTFVQHYGGDYDIFMEDGWTVVRICLPIKQ